FSIIFNFSGSCLANQDLLHFCLLLMSKSPNLFVIVIQIYYKYIEFGNYLRTPLAETMEIFIPCETTGPAALPPVLVTDIAPIGMTTSILAFVRICETISLILNNSIASSTLGPSANTSPTALLVSDCFEIILLAISSA